MVFGAKRKILLLGMIGFIGIGFLLRCADRKRDNPLDPKNERTEGRPIGLRVISLGRKVLLRWESISVNGLLGMKIFRRSSIDSVYREIALVRIGSSYEDGSVEFGVTYTYRIRAVTESYESPFSDEVSITPGPSTIWVTTGSAGGLFKLTHDASHLIFERNPFLFTLAITPVPVEKGVFITDFYLDQVIRVSENGNILRYLSGFQSPIDIAYDPRRRKIWLADRDDGRIFVSDTTGNQVKGVANFQFPVALSLDPSADACWVADPRARQVAYVDARSGTVARFSGFHRPEDVDVNRSDATCWVADSSEVVLLDREGHHLITVSGFNHATDVAVNEKSGECWVIDWFSGINRTRVVKVSNTGNRLLEATGFYNPQSLDVDPFDGSCVVADSWNFRIVKLSSEGEPIGEWRASGPPMFVKVISP